MSKGSSRQKLTVDWNPELRLWTKAPEQEGFFELSVPFSETWPPSGSMRSGRAWPRRRSALPIPGSGSSSTPGRLMPTPTASNPNEGESVESWEARRQRNLAKGINGNGQGTPLGIAVKLLKTPTAQLAVNGGSQHPDKRKSGGHGPTLADEVEHLLPTPRARDSKGPGYGDDLPSTANRLLPTPRATRGGASTETVYSLGGERTDQSRPQGEVLLPTPSASFASTTANFRPDGTPYGEGYGKTLLDAVRLLPTPRASDAEKGGPNQRGSKGDLMLPSAVAQLLPTPTASDGDRTSCSYGRGNPTLTGAITSPPSDGGKPSSDGPLPGPLTLWDD